MENTKIFSGTANKPLAEAVCEYLKVSPGKLETRRFSDGEMFAEIDESVRKKDTFVIQPTCPPVNDNLMELLIIIDALKRASAGSISAVIPYYGYARQDRKVLPRAPITAVSTKMLSTMRSRRPPSTQSVCNSPVSATISTVSAFTAMMSAATFVPAASVTMASYMVSAFAPGSPIARRGAGDY